MLKEILELPAIVQGALGSALFAIVLWLLKLGSSFLIDRVSFLDNKMKVHKINTQLVRCKALQHGEPETVTFALVGLIYLALANILKAVICLIVGYGLSSYILIFSDISLVFALYFVFQALACVSDEAEGDNYQEKIEDLEGQLSELTSEKK
ncbi:hypothetical protein DA096_09200 [Vibrio rotiferianus]|uniref:hypothetical protein n=1 Tax=Vibrio rotiferianus TaxID=190895 RepID=UPI00111066C0|nr:hypothetical protein [Vibrio rotiferianus]TMX38872.1 hypothetical protein DA095_10690 [Vibrio rotiferianus]TMX55091.1 hypothetical protein DA093_08535 [Vibrio rotiferianus]TMX65597.1 hypothetical protein DA096_09200 [Vibrio rotiferianus]